MKSSQWAGLVMIAGAGILFGCEQAARNQEAANSNLETPAETASTQGAGPASVSAGEPVLQDALRKDQSATNSSAMTGAPSQGVLSPDSIEDFTPNFPLPPLNTE